MSTRIDLQRLDNTRDLGGMKTEDGRIIRSNLFVRSGHLYYASLSDLTWLSAHVGLVIDFRTKQERTEKPDPVIPGVETVHLPIFDSLAAGVSRDEKSDEKAFAMVAQDPARAKAYMIGTYRGFVISDFSVSQYKQFVHFLLDSREKAVLWHCTAGKDRAGFASVIVQELLGVKRVDIMSDYLATNKYLEAEVHQLYEMVGQQMGGLNERTEKALNYLFGAHREYLEAVYEAVEESYGGFDGFIRDGLRISEAEREVLRERSLVSEFPG